MSQPQPPPKQIAIDLSPEAADGVYANLTIIASNPSEFVLDFARLLPGLPKAKVHARVILTPAAAKALHRHLGQNIERFEQQNGEIRLKPGTQPDSAQIGFLPD
ncbi:MAG TPA: DUF3467 domain-containing protein [Candidatus Krumholzibacteria bacterium]|nr:DUF3467 domain-containing protein [Candidatus Krumholzibacteria bacterium]HPD71479.1 DUF3467 domain-containing protein [Candidatus Krumholzibacteria bacterium]HRY41588.1 DUF3467 domain-containing protein [Candidatus Krumholzibacteria bacterium]